MAAQLITVRLSRGDLQPWGFRLQGGADFGTPLLVQKINSGSLADQAGLIPGDAVIKINDVDVYTLRHKDAQDVVVRSGNTFTMTVQRGGSTWRPHVQVTGQLPSPGYGGNVPTVTRTSLAHQYPQPVEHIGCGYNNAARPFGAVNGGDGPVKSIVNKQYNSPVGIYSDESIAETLSAQAEVLAGGVLGVNFKKNEKEYNPNKSEVLKFLKEEQSEPHEPAYQQHQHTEQYHQQQHQQQQQHHHQHQPHYQNTSGPVRHVMAPINQPKPQNTGGLPAGQNICDECERLIVGVFCRIKDKNLHVECFRCATCGTSLKNQGYYNYNNKLYCDIHAKLAAQRNPPPGTEGYVPIPIKPTGKLSGNVIANALNAHGYKIQTNGATPVVLTGPNANQGYGSPRPFNQGPMSPHSAGQRSPGASYPPAKQQQQWSQPAQSPYATLPRTGGQGRHSSYNNYSNTYNKSSTTVYNKPQPVASHYNEPQSVVNNFKRGPSGKPVAGGAFSATSAPKRGRGILNRAVAPGGRIPQCGSCQQQIRGPFITALGRIWCPEHFMCVNGQCRRPLQDIGFVEEKGDLYCEFCFEKFLAPTCSKCNGKIKGDCLNAIGRHFHPECFTCRYCGKIFGNTPFFLEDAEPYCEADWNELFTTKCFACGFPVEAGDRWVEALNHNYHSQCFNCTMCKKNLEGQSFYNKGGRPFCKNHAR